MTTLSGASRLAIVLGLVALGTLFVYWYNQPSTLRLLIPNIAPAEQRLFGSLGEVLRRDRAGIRLEIVATEDVGAGLEAFEKGTYPLAIMRLDAVPARTAQEIAVVRREAVVLVVPANSTVESFRDLDGRKLGVARNLPANTMLAENLLEQFGLSEQVELVPLAYGDVGAAVRERKVAAVLLVGAPSQRIIQDTVADIARAGEGEPNILPVELTEAVAGRSPRYEIIEVRRGAFGGSVPRPAQNVTTTQIALRLMARPEVTTAQGSELLAAILSNRQRLATDNPIAALMEAPDTESDTTVTVHRGALAHLNGEAQGFLDRYSDLLYILLFFGSFLGSAFAGLIGFLRGRRRDAAAAKLEELADMMRRATIATELGELLAIEREADAIVLFVLNGTVERTIEQQDATALQLGLEALRVALKRARKEITRATPGAGAMLAHAAE
jgi:TRAP-type uncharacterized transport system substrate-binding protein